MAPDLDADATAGSGGGRDPSGPASPDMEPLACVSCRARKLKCDRTKPACTRCTKVNNECVYPESRRKPTFKRRNVKELEARLAQVEDYLKEVTRGTEEENGASAYLSRQADVVDDYGVQENGPNPSSGPNNMPSISPNFATNGTAAGFNNQELVSLGLSEALPPFEVMEELTTLYFTTQHPQVPFVHPGRYWQAFYGSRIVKPPMCLQYAMWAMASQNHPKYGQYADIFYKRARQYGEVDEMKGTGEHFITISHAQAYIIMSTYEAKSMLFTRAAMTSAKCVRLVEMMGLDRLDGQQDDMPPMLAPVTSWVELEERRRTFWGAFALDSHASISTGWPSLINPDEVTTRLPASEQAFLSGTEEKTPFLEDVYTGATYSGYAGTLVICALFRAIMHHVHRSRPNDHPEDMMSGKFWARHRDLDNRTSGTFMFLPDNLTLPRNIRDPSALNTNLNLHASVICLHHAAIEKADRYGLPDSVKKSSILRLRAAAQEIVDITRLVTHNRGAFKTPLAALSIYCAHTVYIYVAKEDPNNLTPIDRSNLEILISTMEAIGRMHVITRSFLQQACLDVERNDLASVIQLPSLGKYRNLYGGPCSNIPMLARNAVGRHSEIAPVLPGRLPLGNPKGQAPPNVKTQSEGIPPAPSYTQSSSNFAGFQPVLGVISRNIGVPQDYMEQNQSHKRKRMSPSPVAPVQMDAGMMPMPPANGAANVMVPGDYPPEIINASSGKLYNKQHGNFALPDRTASSVSSSPLIRTGGYAETQSTSSETSPGVMGLGNTAEENRVDLRQFQDRITTPLWQTAADEMFFGQVTDPGVNASLPTDGNDPWGILNASLDWETGHQGC